MSTPTQAYPLTWPAGCKRANRRVRSRFGHGATADRKPSIAAALDEAQNQLRQMGATRVIVSSDLLLRNDGLPRSGQPAPRDPGVAVYFTLGNEQKVIAIDLYDLPGCNLYAIAKTVEAMRGIERWGGAEVMSRVFVGFKALPQEASRPSWETVLDVNPNCTYEQAKAAWRALVTRYHPDNNALGDREKFQQVQEAWADAQKHFNTH